MKSQLLTTLSIVGVLGTATTAMAANTDVLASLDSPEIGSATEVLLPATSSTTEPIVSDPTATPAPTDPSATPAPSPSSGSTTPSGGTGNSGSGQAPSGGTAPAAQPAQAQVVNGTSGGSGSRVAPAAGVPGATTYNDDDEDHEDGDHEEEHEEDDD